ncbi:MAG: hypothetical protein HFJ66_09500 [Eggerthellaceae bacterium]|nr:hypothetical protein [Eggerthellaceae bacterium]
MAPFDTIDRASAIGRRVSGDVRISVTELSRGNEWRSQLPVAGVIEITDRGDTAGWLLSDEDMRSLVASIALLEEELEQAQIAAMFKAREGAQPQTGEALKDAALKTFEARKARLGEIVYGD